MEELLEKHERILAELGSVFLAIEELNDDDQRKAKTTQALAFWTQKKAGLMLSLAEIETLLSALECKRKIRELEARVVTLSLIVEKISAN